MYIIIICNGEGMNSIRESRVEAAIMGQVVLWDTACNFNAIILNKSILNCLITGESTLCSITYHVLYFRS